MVWVAGQKLQDGKYTIEKELGEGGFGITYLAKDNNERQVVIKTLNDAVQHRTDFAKFQQDFLNEALRLARCSHPHIVRVDEVINEGHLWCIVMEYIDGEDLANLVKNQGALPEAKALRYIQQIGEALTVIHNNGLLHRDIKPHNIMLRSGKSEAVLIDFGIAREFTPNLTQTHTQMLSDGFAPIEQYDKRAKRGAYTDVYALAATLYTLLTGEVPIIAPLLAIGTLLEEPKQINSSISDRVNQAIVKGMEVKAENRPQSIQEWLALLDPGLAIPISSTAKSPSVIPIISPPPYQSLSQTSAVKLISTVGVDYSRLQDLLASGKWKEADQETAAVVLKITNREKEGWLDIEAIKKIPDPDFCTIEKLWLRYSNGHFGYSVQKSIWQSVGGKLHAGDKTWQSFGDRLGWFE
ncbi:serine/threonine-protein kinase [Trichocoleus sp. DQ-U1]|uniref:serine/threonine-protein kinase n=1 Tax=Trichocoleus sp. DQ-U1 TaxID=2933926 RepID=UPI0032997F9D